MKNGKQPSKDCRPPKPQSTPKVPNSIPSAGFDDDRPLVLHIAGRGVLPDGTRQLKVHCDTLVDFVCMPENLVFGPIVIFKAEWDSENKLAYYRERKIQPERKNDEVAAQEPDVRVNPHPVLESQMEPGLGKLSYGGQGKERSSNEADRVGELERDASVADDPVQNHPPKLKRRNFGFPGRK